MVHSRSLMAPRSVMDIPQTRSSMAKIAYSRKRLFEQKQPELRQKWAAQARHHHPQQGGAGPAQGGGEDRHGRRKTIRLCFPIQRLSLQDN